MCLKIGSIFLYKFQFISEIFEKCLDQIGWNTLNDIEGTFT